MCLQSCEQLLAYLLICFMLFIEPIIFSTERQRHEEHFLVFFPKFLGQLETFDWRPLIEGFFFSLEREILMK